MEAVKYLINEYWVECFQKHYPNEFINLYMHCIDQSRHVANNARHFEHYFQQVHLTLLLI